MFTGYSDKTVDFFWDIRFNNSREWFHPRKEQFNDYIMTPTKALSGELYDWLTQTYPDLHLNLHISKIYRDARRLFGRGPLKDHIWFSFQNELEGRANAPCLWFEVGCEGYSYGFGYWCEPSAAARFRKLADRNVKELEALAKKLEQQNVFLLHGPEYARAKGHADDAIAGWYNRRSFSIVCERSYDALSYSRELLDAVKDGFRFLMPYYQYFDRSYRMAN